jgi:hypothetical protein
MLTQLAALGIGLITTVAAPAALASPCDPAHPTAGYPTYGAPVPTYGPASYPPPYAAPPPYAPPPPYAGPRAHPRRVEAQQVVMRRADYNRDGGVTYAEAHAYGRDQFARADYDRNGVLTRRELRESRDDFTRVSHGRGGVVTLAEFDAAVYDQFYQLDYNRDGFLSRYELGFGAPPAPSSRVTWSWNWSL